MTGSSQAIFSGVIAFSLLAVAGHSFAQELPAEQNRAPEVILNSMAVAHGGTSTAETTQSPRPLVTIGFDTIAGAPRYADRSTENGTMADVRFSRTRMRASASLAGLPSRLPVSGARLSSRYGYRVHPISGRGSSHRGVDLAVARGTSVTATLDGTVARASWSGGYGLLVTVDHGGGLETRYAHLSSIAVRPGQAVRAGQSLGRSGATGNTTGPHVHYEVRVNGVAVDPLRH